MSCVDPINLPGLLKATRQYRNTDPPVNTTKKKILMGLFTFKERESTIKSAVKQN